MVASRLWMGYNESIGDYINETLSQNTQRMTLHSEPPSRTARYSRPGWLHLAVLLAFLILTVLMTWPLAMNVTTAIPGDSFDGWQNYWNLWWIKTALIEQIHNPYITNALFYPTGVNLYFHTLNPFNGLLTLPIQLSAGLLPAYNAVVFFSWMMGGYGVYLLVLWILTQRCAEKNLTSNIQHIKWAAFLAGVIFTFSPFHMAHLLGHMQVMSLEWLPFYVLYLLRAMAARRDPGKAWVRSALLAGFFLILTGLCDWYFVLYLFFFTALVISWRVVGTIGQWRSASKRLPSAVHRPSLITLIAPALIAGGLFVILLSPILLPMLREATEFSFMVRPSVDLYIFSASFLDFFVPNRLHPLFLPGSLTWIGNQVAPPSEHTISIGYTALALALIALWKDRRRSAFWLVSALFFLLLALGPRLHFGNITQADMPSVDAPSHEWTLYAILNRLVPFMRISRSVSRYALMVELSVAVAAGLGLAALFHEGRPGSTSRSRRMILLFCLLCSLVLAEFWVAPFPLSPPDTPAFYTQLRDRPETGAVLNLPMNYDRPGYLLYQTVHEKPLTIGYISRDDPRTLTERAPVLQHFRHLGPDILEVDPAFVGMTVLHDLGVGFVIEDRYKMPGGEERMYTEALAKAIFVNQSPLYQDDRLTAYQVQTPAHPVPYAVLGAFNWGPLLVDKAGQRGRALTNKPALLSFYHLPQQIQLRIRYRTQSTTGLMLALPDLSQKLAILPPAPNGNEVTVDLRRLLGDSTKLTSIALVAETATGVTIEQIGLVLP